MILRILLCTAVISVAVVPGMATEPQGPSRLTSIAYGLHDSLSRMTFSFNGPVTYAVTRNGDDLTLRFAKMTAAKELQGSRRTSFSGMIRSVVVTPLPNVELAVTVSMKNASPYRFVHARTANSFSLEVIGRDPAMAPSGVVSPAKMAAKSPIKPAVKNPEVPRASRAVIDIPGMARAQLQESDRNNRSGREVSLVTSDRHPLEAGLMLAAIVVFPLVTGATILFVLYQRKRKRERNLDMQNASVDLEPVPESPVVEPEQMPVSEESNVVEEPVLLPAMACEVDEVTDDRPFQIAQSMIQGNEQYALAKRFASETSDITRNKIRKACRTKTASTHRVRVAKRLGVGKGEVELALKLRDIAAKRPRKEKKR